MWPLLFLTLSSGVSTMCHLVPLYVYGYYFSSIVVLIRQVQECH